MRLVRLFAAAALLVGVGACSGSDDDREATPDTGNGPAPESAQAGPRFFLKDVLDSANADRPSVPAEGVRETSRPVAGDWDGDGRDTPGVFTDGTFTLTTESDPISVRLGNEGDLPIAGDWNGDGVDSVGVYRSGVFYMWNGFASRVPPDFQIKLGQEGDVPVAGDWDGDGSDSPGIFREGTFYLSAGAGEATTTVRVKIGGANHLPLAGDWDGDNVDTVGVVESGTYVLRNTLRDDSESDVRGKYARETDLYFSGDWNSDGVDSLGVFRYASGN